MITGILSADPTGPLFPEIMGRLQEIACLDTKADSKLEDDKKLPQVHALNCLKDVFNNTRLGPSSEAFLMSSLNISVHCLGSPM